MNLRRIQVAVVAVALAVTLVAPVSVWAAEPGLSPWGPADLWRILVDLWEGWTGGWSEDSAQPESDLRSMDAAAETTASDDPTVTEDETLTPETGPLGLSGGDDGDGDEEGSPRFDPGG